MPASGVLAMSPSSRFMPPVVNLSIWASSSACRYPPSLACLRSSSSRSFAACSAYHPASWVLTYGSGRDAGFGVSSFSRPTMEIRPRSWSFSTSLLVQTMALWLSVPARGLFAARTGMARVLRVTEIATDNVRQRFISLPLVFLRRGGRKMLEHFVHPFVEVLCVLVRLIGERTAR